MRVIESVAEMRAARREMAGRVALVPTMGALHEGHMALLRRARATADVVVASLFVNPAQFGEGEDFASYPRDRARDLAVFERLGADAVFAPAVEDMYPEGGETTVDPGPPGDALEGARRPGHFRGVATVVAKLFILIRPHAAFFGEKDAQQLVIIRRMVRDLLFDIEIVAVPTVRAADGLALSSRNAYLSVEERAAATVLYRSLQLAERLWRAGETDAAAIRARMEEMIARTPRARLEYVSIADPFTLREMARIEPPALVSLAARVGPARLIDNVTLRRPEETS